MGYFSFLNGNNLTLFYSYPNEINLLQVLNKVNKVNKVNEEFIEDAVEFNHKDLTIRNIIDVINHGNNKLLKLQTSNKVNYEEYLVYTIDLNIKKEK